MKMIYLRSKEKKKPDDIGITQHDEKNSNHERSSSSTYRDEDNVSTKEEKCKSRVQALTVVNFDVIQIKDEIEWSRKDIINTFSTFYFNLYVNFFDEIEEFDEKNILINHEELDENENREDRNDHIDISNRSRFKDNEE